MPIRFFSEELEFKLKHPRKTSNWIKEVIAKEKASIGDLSYIFCNDTYLLEINKKYLNHNTLTDIITFDNNEDDSNLISGDIFISIDRVKDNSKHLNIPSDEELHRVIIHGVLHLLGYKDKKPADKAQMRKKEEAYLSLRK
jgi:rRNA maturation RNase YbeY